AHHLPRPEVRVSKLALTPSTSTPQSRSRLSALLPVLVAFLAIAHVVWWGLIPHPDASTYRLADFRRAPVLHEGRVKPIESAAPASLMFISNRQTLKVHDHEKSATEWVLDAMAKPETADEYPIFRVDHPDIQALLTTPTHQGAYNYFSFKEMVAQA